MKKILTMFAFAAAIVLGAFTFASCDDDKNDPPVVIHEYGYSVSIKTKNELTLENPMFKELQKSTKEELEKDLNSFTGTDEMASALWDKTLELYNDKVFNTLQDFWAQFHDEGIFCEMIILRDGMAWKTMVWKKK